MTPKKKLARPTWTAIKKYVEGRLLDERRRFDAKLQAARSSAADELSKVENELEALARDVHHPEAA